MLQHVFNTVFKRCGGAGAASASAAHMQVNNTALKRREDDIAAVLRNDGADAGIKKFFDLPHRGRGRR